MLTEKRREGVIREAERRCYKRSGENGYKRGEGAIREYIREGTMRVISYLDVDSFLALRAEARGPAGLPGGEM